MRILEKIKNLFKVKPLNLNQGAISEEQKLTNLLHSKYNETYETLDQKILQEKYRQKLGIDKIEILSLYPNVQRKILDLSDKELDIFVKLLEYAQKEQKDWIPVTEELISIVKDESYRDICDNFDKIPEEDKWKFLNIIFSPTWQFVDIHVNSIEDISTYYDRKKELISSIIKEPEKNNERYYWDYELEDASPIEKVKYAILALKYGMNYDKVKSLNAYRQDLDIYTGTPEGKILKDINDILEETDIKKLQNINLDESQIDYKALVNIESTLDNILIKKYNEKLYTPKESDFVGTEKVVIKDENGIRKEVDVKVYNVIGDKSKEIYMVTHARGGLWGCYDEDHKENYKEDWFRPNLKNNVVSTCCVSNEFWGKVSGWCTFGFCNFKSNTLYNMAPNDAGSGTVSFGKEIEPQPHLGPKKLIDNIVQYSEMVWRRLELKNGEYHKKAPDYIVYMKEPKSDRQRNDKKARKMYEEDQKWTWKESKKAAAELGIPIVVVDIEKSLELESKAIEESFRKFELTGGRNQELLKSIMTKFENNRYYLTSKAGDYKELEKEYFSKESYKSYLSKIMEIIEKSDENNRQKSLDNLINITSLERARWLREYLGDYREYLKNRTMDYDKFLERLQQLKDRKVDENDISETSKPKEQDAGSKEDLKSNFNGR